MSNPEGPAKISSFEDTIRVLGDIVRKLEEGELTLEQSLEAFERGIVLAREAKLRLDAAEARVDELLGVDPQGAAVTKPFEGRER